MGPLCAGVLKNIQCCVAKRNSNMDKMNKPAIGAGCISIALKKQESVSK